MGVVNVLVQLCLHLEPLCSFFRIAQKDLELAVNFILLFFACNFF